MKHLFAMATAVGLLIAAGGCAFFSSGYRETREYDIAAAASRAKISVPIPVRLGVFGNLSGAGLSFLVRDEGDRVSSDPYNRWLSSPEQMIEREFRKLICGVSPQEKVRTYVKLSCRVLAFEFDRPRRTARLSMDFTAAFYDDSVLVRANSAQRDFEAQENGLDNDTPNDAVAAMSRCVGEAAAFAAGLISKTADKTAAVPPDKE